MRYRFLLAFMLLFALPRPAQAIDWNGKSMLVEITGDTPVHRYLEAHLALRYFEDPAQHRTLAVMGGATVQFLNTHALTLRYGWEDRWLASQQTETTSYSMLYRGWFSESGISLRLESSIATDPKQGPKYRGWYNANFRIIGREMLKSGPLLVNSRPAFTGGTTLGFGGQLAPLTAAVGAQIEQADRDVLGGPHLNISRLGDNWLLEVQYLIGHRYTWSHEARGVLRLEF